MTYSSTTYLIFVVGSILLVLSFVDTIVMSMYLDSITKRQSPFTYHVFVSIVVVSITAQSLTLYIIRKKKNSADSKPKTRSSVLLEIWATSSLCVLISLFLYLIALLLYQRAYFSDIFKLVVYLSYAFSVINIGLLIISLTSWYKRNHGIVMLLYVIAISAFLINEVSSILILSSQLSGPSQKISFVTNPWDNRSLILSSFNDFYKITSILSFTVAWLATCLLLHYYSRKLGRWKFWLLATLPLVYYLGNLDIIRASIFNYVLHLNPQLLSTVQFALGGAKQAGGFFFAISFVMISRNVDNQKLKLYLLISGTGIMLLFSSNQISLVQLLPYPPFGLTTISLISISSFLLLIGLHSLAHSMAHDKQLLEFIRKLVNQKASKFLFDIGSAQWQKEIDRTIPMILNSNSSLIKESSSPTSLTEQEIKDYIYEISKEMEKMREEG
ncbi:MAG: hypothetical protein AB7U98_14855 [Candidatus Nitrosocosmicus sp.]